MITIYRAIAYALSDHVRNRHALLQATDSVLQALADLPEIDTNEPLPVPLEVIALTAEPVLDLYFKGKKIEAIKALRELTGASLAECKDAILNLDDVPGGSCRHDGDPRISHRALSLRDRRWC